MKRREFIVNATGAAGSAVAWARGSALAQTSAPEGDAKLARICISSWSFHTLFTATQDRKGPPISGKPLDVLDFPGMIADRYRVHTLEIVAPHFASSEPSYFNEFKNRLKRAHSRLANIPADIPELGGQPALSSPEPAAREHAISLYTKWIDNAHELGARSVRCDPGKINTADLSPTIASYKTLVAYGRSKGIDVIVENHGGAGSEHPETLAQILKASGAGALPDFGNFPNEETRERGLRLLFPLAITVCHAKLNPARFDIARCVQISKDAGYKGVYSIEAGGRGDPYEAVRQVMDELEKNL